MIEQIKALRKQIPIGMQEAKALLQQLNGNVSEAEAYWKNKQAQLLSKETYLSEQEAAALLGLTHFNVDAALGACQENSPSQLRLLLQTARKEQQAMDRLHAFITEYLSDGLSEKGFIHSTGFEKLPLQVQNVLLLWQWYMTYESRGGFFDQDITWQVADVLERELNLTSFSNEIREVRAQYEKHQENTPPNLTNEQWVAYQHELELGALYQGVHQSIVESEEAVKKKLIQYLVDHEDALEKELDSFRKAQKP